MASCIELPESSPAGKRVWQALSPWAEQWTQMPPRGDGSFAVGSWHPGHPPWFNFLEGAWGHKWTCLHLTVCFSWHLLTWAYCLPDVGGWCGQRGSECYPCPRVAAHTLFMLNLSSFFKKIIFILFGSILVAGSVIVVHRLLVVALGGRSSCGVWAELLCGTWDLSSLTGDGTHTPCITRWTLNH